MAEESHARHSGHLRALPSAPSAHPADCKRGGRLDYNASPDDLARPNTSPRPRPRCHSGRHSRLGIDCPGVPSGWASRLLLFQVCAAGLVPILLHIKSVYHNLDYELSVEHCAFMSTRSAPRYRVLPFAANGRVHFGQITMIVKGEAQPNWLPHSLRQHG